MVGTRGSQGCCRAHQSQRQGGHRAGEPTLEAGGWGGDVTISKSCESGTPRAVQEGSQREAQGRQVGADHRDQEEEEGRRGAHGGRRRGLAGEEKLSNQRGAKKQSNTQQSDGTMKGTTRNLVFQPENEADSI